MSKKAPTPRVHDVHFLLYDHNYGKFHKRFYLRRSILSKLNGLAGLEVRKVVVKISERGRPRRKSRR